MTWTRYPASTWGVDAKPVSAAAMVDLVRGNCDHLLRNSPASCGHFWINGPPTSTSTAYDDASTVWRSPRLFIRSGLDRPLRVITCKVRAYMNSGTGSVRITASQNWHIVAATPAGGDLSAESASGAVTSTSSTDPTEVTLTLTPTFDVAGLSSYGSGGAGRDDVRYRATYLTIQAIAALTKTITVQAFTIEETDP